VHDFLGQLPALLGVVLGAVGAIGATTLSDRLRWRRDQATRWDERRLDAYITFAGTLKEIHALAFRLVAAHRPGSKAQPIDRETGLALMAQANVRRTADWESVLLLGDAATVTAARQWREAVVTVELLARAERWDAAAWEPAVDGADRTRDQFYLVARQSLGIGSGSVEQLPHLRARRLTP
jgi:hypothetical protein